VQEIERSNDIDDSSGSKAWEYRQYIHWVPIPDYRLHVTIVVDAILQVNLSKGVEPLTKFSVYIPTRNRLDLLQFAVSSVIQQNYSDWELIVSDNDSEDDVAGYIQSLNDHRIKYYRTDHFVSVTENWNNALSHTTGEYVTLLGDDDCLMPDYFSALTPLIEQFHQPDVIHTDGYLFLYPGIVMERTQNGMLLTGYNSFFNPTKSYLLERKEALTLVRNSLQLKIDFLYNLQLFCVRREFVQSLAAKGKFFQSPFPDYYVLVMLFLKATTILIYQQPMVVVGISPKSIGYLLFNKREQEGVSQLNNLGEYQSSRLANKMFPGNYEIANRLIAMDVFQQNYDEELRSVGIEVDYGAFRRAQIRFNYERYYLDRLLPQENFHAARTHMTQLERFWYDMWLMPTFVLLRQFSPRIRGGLIRRFRKLIGHRVDYGYKRWSVVDFKNILEVAQQMPSRHIEQV